MEHEFKTPGFKDSPGGKFGKQFLEEAHLRREKSLVLKEKRPNALYNADDSSQALATVRTEVTALSEIQDSLIAGIKNKLESIGLNIDVENPIHGALIHTPAEDYSPNPSRKQLSRRRDSGNSSSNASSRNVETKNAVFGTSSVRSKQPCFDDNSLEDDRSRPSGHKHSHEKSSGMVGKAEQGLSHEEQNIRSHNVTDEDDKGSSDGDNIDSSIGSLTDDTVSVDETDLANMMYYQQPLLFLNEACFLKGGRKGLLCHVVMLKQLGTIVAPHVDANALFSTLQQHGSKIRSMTMRDIVEHVSTIMQSGNRQSKSSYSDKEMFDAVLEKFDATVMKDRVHVIESVKNSNLYDSSSTSSDSALVLRDAVVVVEVKADTFADELKDGTQALSLVIVGRLLKQICEVSNAAGLLAISTSGATSGMPHVEALLKECDTLTVLNSNGVVFSGTPPHIHNYLRAVGGVTPDDASDRGAIGHLTELPNAEDKFTESVYSDAVVAASSAYIARLTYRREMARQRELLTSQEPLTARPSGTTGHRGNLFSKPRSPASRRREIPNMPSDNSRETATPPGHRRMSSFPVSLSRKLASLGTPRMERMKSKSRTPL